MAMLPNDLAEQRTVIKTEPPAGSTLAPAQRFGRYEIIELLGQGGMGAVYLAFDPQLERKIAIKVPTFGTDNPEGLKRFLRESRVIASLNHRHICPVYDYGEEKKVPFLCMPYLPGLPLSKRLTPNLPADLAWTGRLIHQLALAMQYVHDRNIIHRDLKPANILFDDQHEPIIMDFGMARTQNLSSLQLTAHGAIMGTPAYMPPEQVNGEGDRAGATSDIYSLGVILFVMLTGRTPYLGDGLTMMMQIVSDPPPAPSSLRPGLAPEWDAVCLKAMANDPAQRWKNMRAFAQALEPLLTPIKPFITTTAGKHVPDIGSMDTADKPPGRIKSTARLTLRIVGTNLAYRAPPSIEVISVGRQKRKPGDPPGQGNDLVLRVDGNDTLSARISRKHFEIHHDGQGTYALIDQSKLGMTINSQPTIKGQPTQLQHGDLLHVAGVVHLAVFLEDTPEWQAVRPGAVVQAPAPINSPAQAQGHQLQLEASLGDFCTIDGEA